MSFNHAATCCPLARIHGEPVAVRPRTNRARTVRGLTPYDAKTATINAMNEITEPIIAITLVLSSVFLPSAFLGGISGQFYRQFALTISASMAAALRLIRLSTGRTL